MSSLVGSWRLIKVAIEYRAARLINSILAEAGGLHQREHRKREPSSHASKVSRTYCAYPEREKEESVRSCQNGAVVSGQTRGHRCGRARRSERVAKDSDIGQGRAAKTLPCGAARSVLRC